MHGNLNSLQPNNTNVSGISIHMDGAQFHEKFSFGGLLFSLPCLSKHQAIFPLQVARGILELAV